MRPAILALLALAASSGFSAAVSIDTVYFAQTHVQEPAHPYFYLVGNRDTLIKAHVVDPASPASPPVTALLTLDGQTLNLPLTGPALLPASIPNGPGVVQHSPANTFTAMIPKAWVKSGLTVAVTAGAAQANFNTLKIGAPTKVIMTMFDVQYFADANSDYPAGTLAELEAKWPVAELEVRRIPHVVFPELVIPPRGGAPAARVKSKADYTAQTGLGFDGEQAAALAWNGALKAAAGKSGRVSLYYTNIYGVGAGGQAGGFAGVGSGTSVGILHHELGHALSLPHWGDSTTYPYKGAMHGIAAPAIYNETHAGPTWAFHLPTRAYIPCTVQPGNVGGKPTGTYKCDPMQGGGTGFQEPGYLMNHFSDYSVFKMRSYLDGHVVVWNPSLGNYAYWNQSARDYTNVVANNGVSYPVERDVPVIAVMASISGANPSVNMAYPPIGPFSGGLIRLFDPTVAADRTAAQSIFSPASGSDLCLRVIQGGIEKTYMLAASWEPAADPLTSGSLKTAALNLPASGGTVTRIDLLLTPDAEDNGLPANPQVLYSWPNSLIAVPAGLTATGGDGSISLAWNASQGATAYTVKRAGVSGGPYTPVATTTTTSHLDTTVANGTAYHYVVSATTAAGTSADSDQASATPIPPPATPADLAATPGAAVVVLTWSASAGATGYKLKRALASGGPFTTIQTQPGTGFNDLSVINGVSYYYKISAFNDGGDSPDSALAGPAIPQGVPAIPAGFTATASNLSVILTWSAVPGASSYNLKRSLTPGGPHTTIQSVTGTSFTDLAVSNGSTYYYVVAAANGFGEGADSLEASAAVSRIRYWDGGSTDIGTNGNGASAGGAGTWNNTLLNWDAGAAPHVAWDNAANDTAVFAGTGAAVNVAESITAGGITLSSAGYTFTGSTVAIAAGGIFKGTGTYPFDGFALAPGNTTYRFESTSTSTGNFSNSTVFTMTSAFTGAGNSMVISGTQPVYLQGTNSYGGGTAVMAGAALGFNAADITGIPAASVTVGTNASILRAGGSLNNTLLQRLAPTPNVFTIYGNNGGTASALDLTNFPNASLAFWDNVGTQSFAFTGTITPANGTYRFGGARAGNYVNLNNANSLTGTHSLVVTAGKVRLLSSNNFSGETLVNATNAGTLYLCDNLALQNSAIDTSGAGKIDLSGGRPPGSSATPVTSPVVGGLRGDRNLADVFSSHYSAVTSLTLNPGAAKSHTYSGIIADGAAGMSLTKAGAGTQVLTGVHSYTGQTLVLGGTLRVNSPGSLPAGSDVVVSAGTLGGSGTINGHVYLESSGSISPGDPVGTLYITGGLDLFNQAAGTGKLLFDLAGPADSQDRISIASHLELGDGALGFSDFVFTDLGGLQAGIYKLITSGQIPAEDSLDPDDLTGMIGSLPASLRISSDHKDLELVVGDDYLLWSSAFPGADLTDPDADLDGDGLSNDEERIFGLIPDNGASVNPIAIPLNAAAGTLSYTRRTRNLSGKSFSIWTSPDLVVWTHDSGAVQTPDAPVNEIENVAVTLSPPLLTAPKLFIQIRATP
jgi:autotransporter-associated beta strand protein